MRGVVERQIRNDVVQGDVPQTEVGGHGLEFAVLVAAACQALVGVLGHDHLDDRAPDLDQLRVLGDDVHARLERRAAGTEHLLGAGDPDDADAARGRRVEVRMLAQRGDVDRHLTRGVEDRRAGLDLNREVVDCRRDELGRGGHFGSVPARDQTAAEFWFEVAEGGKHWVRRSLPEAA